MSGKQIKLFLIDGTPGGLTTAEITNWTGHALAAGRSDLADLLKRDEAQRTGAYLLLGDDEEAVGNTRCYIGEADIVADRLRYHQRDKDFWDRLVVITSKDANLSTRHASGRAVSILPVFPFQVGIPARLNAFRLARHLQGVIVLPTMLNCLSAACEHPPCGTLSGEFSPHLPLSRRRDLAGHTATASD